MSMQLATCVDLYNVTVLFKVPDSAILENSAVADLEGKDFMNPEHDHTAIGKKDSNKFIS